MAKRRDNDSPWKELLEQDLSGVLAFFTPEIHADLDWLRDFESLEQELRPQIPFSPVGGRIADKLVKAYRRADGEPRYLHLEIQARREKDFPHRVYVYNQRASDKVGTHVVSIVLLVDRHEDWKPTRYVADQYGCRKILQFLRFKLLEYRGREEFLRTHENPVGLFLLAALEAQRTKANDPARETIKLELILRLTERKMDRESLRHWYRYLDWLLPLSAEANRRVLEHIRLMEEGTTVPYISFAEREAIRIGRREGREEGREEGRQEGREEGRQEGQVEGRRKTLLETLPLILKLKFGEPGAAFADELGDASLERLEIIFGAVETAGSVDQLRRLS